MTIVKIKNPVLRWLVGLGCFIVLIVITGTILYLVGIIAAKIYPFSFPPFATAIEEGIIMTIVVGISFFIIIAIIGLSAIVFGILAKELSNKFFDNS